MQLAKGLYGTLHKKVCEMIASHRDSFVNESFAKLYKRNDLNKLRLIT